MAERSRLSAVLKERVMRYASLAREHGLPLGFSYALPMTGGGLVDAWHHKSIRHAPVIKTPAEYTSCKLYLDTDGSRSIACVPVLEMEEEE